MRGMILAMAGAAVRPLPGSPGTPGWVPPAVVVLGIVIVLVVAVRCAWIALRERQPRPVVAMAAVLGVLFGLAVAFGAGVTVVGGVEAYQRTNVLPAECDAVRRQNVEAFQSVYHLRSLSGWDGSPVAGVYDVTYVPRGGWVEPLKGALLVHDGESYLLDGSGGREAR